MTNPTEQFEVLSNALRIYPERLMQANYYINKVNDPEEGIANIESSFREVLNQLYGMMCALKDDGYINGLYENVSITSLLCLRHTIQHLSGKVKNLHRDLVLNNVDQKSLGISYSYFEKPIGRTPFYIDYSWYKKGVANSRYSNKWNSIEEYWRFKDIEKTVGNQETLYIDVTQLIQEAVYYLIKKYKSHFTPSGYDSNVYYKHFQSIQSMKKDNWKIDPLELGSVDILT